LLGRPNLYALPTALPWLHLGEMVYHPAHEPRGISIASSALIQSALRLDPDALARRRGIARQLSEFTKECSGIAECVAIRGADPGFLRYPVRDITNSRLPNPSFGVLRSYPVTLLEQPQAASLLMQHEPPTSGALELRSTLFTLPTHGFVSNTDIVNLRQWLAGSTTGRERYLRSI
jgi:hypothetical protein